MKSKGVVPLALRPSVSENIVSRIGEIARRAQIVDFHEWRTAAGYPADPDSSRALTEYLGKWQSPGQYVQYIHEKFPCLKDWTERIVNQTLLLSEEITKYWDQDLPELHRVGLVEGHARISDWKFLFEETHRGGRGAVLLYWKSQVADGRLVYKPRSADGENLLRDVFALVSEPDEKFVPLTLNAHDHSWHEYISREPISDTDRYLRRCGKLLGVCLLLGTTDLHADNIRSGPQNCPVIVDGETAVQLRPSVGLGKGTWELFSTGLIPTTLGAPLLAAYGGLSGEQGLCQSVDQPYVSFELVHEASDAVSVQRARASLQVTPLGNKVGYVDAETRRAKIMEGLLETIEQLRKVPKLSELLEQLVSSQRFRQVIRGTNLYYALLTVATDPSVLANRSPSPFQLLERYTGESSGLSKAVIWSEVAQLRHGDVPYFELSVDNAGSCFIEDGNSLKINVNELGFETGLDFGDRIEWLFNLRSAQLRSALSMNDCSLGEHVSPPQISCLKNYLRETKASSEPNWLWLDNSNPDQTKLVAGGVSMLGSVGTSISLGEVDMALATANRLPMSARQRWQAWGPATTRCLVRGFDDSLKRQWERDLPELLALETSGDFLTGLLGFLAHIPKHWRSADMIQLVSKSAVDDGDGLAHGQAGLFAAGMAVGAVSAQELGSEIASRLTVAENFDQLAWCRGTTGIVAALASNGLLRKTQADDYVQSIKKVCGEAFDSMETVDFSFCHGLTGIIAVLDLLHACSHQIAGLQAENLRREVTRRLERGSGYFLAHPRVKEDPGFLNGYGSLALLEQPGTLHPLLPKIRKEARYALG